jgi:NAD(P)-dependent dehydrogenase (short-subunit alcohol dehydrogenase family)
MEFNGKVSIITGGARGIGRAVCRALATAGSSVVAADLNLAGAEETAAAINAVGGKAMAVACDVASDSAVDELKRVVIARFGKVDILINNAVAHDLAPGRIGEIDIERWKRALDINVLGYVRLMRAFVPDMIERGSGYVVTTSSSLAILPNKATQFMLPYITSKGALLGLSYGLSYALRPQGVVASVFCPGLTSTQDDGKPKKAVAGFLSDLPERLTKPATAEFAAAVLLGGMRREEFLICSQPDYEVSISRFANNQLGPHSQFQ